jgi:hypothetical protein
MNPYRAGSSMVASRFGSAHKLAQLKGENPTFLRTIWDFDLLPFSPDLTAAGATLISPEALIKLD